MSRVWIVALSLLSNILGLALPLALIQVYDRIIPNQSLGTAAVLFSAVLIALLLDGLARFARSAIFARIGSVEEHRLSLRVAKHVLTMPRERFGRMGAGRIDGLFATVARSREILEARSLMGLFDAPFAFAFLALVWFLGGAVVLAPLAVIGVIGALAFRAAYLNRQAVAETRQALRDAWVAEDHGRVVGAVLAYRMTPGKMGADQPHARLKAHALGSWYIDSLAVLEGCRRGGIGLSLLRAADGMAARAGCTAQSLLVYDKNPAAAALYVWCGFAETHAHPLPPEHPTGARALRLLQREITGAEN